MKEGKVFDRPWAVWKQNYFPSQITSTLGTLTWNGWDRQKCEDGELDMVPGNRPTNYPSCKEVPWILATTTASNHETVRIHGRYKSVSRTSLMDSRRNWQSVEFSEWHKLRKENLLRLHQHHKSDISGTNLKHTGIIPEDLWHFTKLFAETDDYTNWVYLYSCLRGCGKIVDGSSSN